MEVNAQPVGFGGNDGSREKVRPVQFQNAYTSLGLLPRRKSNKTQLSRSTFTIRSPA